MLDVKNEQKISV
uniref:Cag pathogenicity island protein n=1 Tax=Helicobacter pylori TaxID=210 RepID=Q75XG5_HELPX|nr:cag pathogenicity island protein [Helicobacter pylori]